MTIKQADLKQFRLERRGHRSGYDGSKRRGALLLIVLVAIVILSLAAYTFMGLMQTEEESTRLQTRRLQCKYLSDSGLDFVRLYLSNSEATIRQKGGRWDNPEFFQGIPVAVDMNNPNQIGYFSIITSSLDDMGDPYNSRFGLVDESCKINLNTLPFSDALQPGSGRNILMALPNMTEDIADAIMDWLDADDDVRDFGAESSFYESLNPAYQTKNGPMDSLDELLLIRDVTPQLLFGLDTNRNGVLDLDEASAGEVSIDDPAMYLGWASFLTLYSKESNLTSEGLPRINVNADDLEQLYDDLKSAYDDNWANFVIYYRCAQSEPTPTLPEDLDEDQIIKASQIQPDFSNLQSQRKFNTILDLVNVYIDMSQWDDENLTSFAESPVTAFNIGFSMPSLMASMTTYEGSTVPGRINIMQAPRNVMLGIPGLDEETVDDIIAAREFELDQPDGADMNRRYETWILLEGHVDLETMKSLMTYVCTGGDVYRAEIVGYFPDGIGTSRAEAVIDTTVPIPRVLFWRDKSHLSTGYSIDRLGINLIE
ncbi:MAG: hypothetical protein AAFN77_10830 [Planctomycetota bacterium]